MKYNAVLKSFFKNAFVMLQFRQSHWIGRSVKRFFPVP